MPRAILVVQLKRIGDLILTTPVLHALRTRFPEARITMACMSGPAGLCPAIPSLDRTLVFHRARPNLPFWRDITFEPYDLAFDFTGNDRSAFAMLLSQAGQRIGYAKPSSRGWRKLGFTGFVDAKVQERHTADHHLRLLDPIGLETAPSQLALEIPVAAHEDAMTRLRDAGLTPPYFVLHPGSARAEKMWSPQGWIDAAHHLHRRHGWSCVLTGSPDPLEAETLQAVRTGLDMPFVDLAGKTGLLSLAALIDGAEMLLAVDSAPMHLAAAFDTPQVVLFGPTNPFHWHPRRDSAHVLGPDGRIPPGQRSYRKAPVTEISTTQVLAAIDQLT